jgi:hypothetical protein
VLRDADEAKKKKTAPSWWRPLRRALAIAGVIVLVIL